MGVSLRQCGSKSSCAFCGSGSEKRAHISTVLLPSSDNHIYVNSYKVSNCEFLRTTEGFSVLNLNIASGDSIAYINTKTVIYTRIACTSNLNHFSHQIYFRVPSFVVSYQNMLSTLLLPTHGIMDFKTPPQPYTTVHIPSPLPSLTSYLSPVKKVLKLILRTPYIPQQYHNKDTHRSVPGYAISSTTWSDHLGQWYSTWGARRHFRGYVK